MTDRVLIADSIETLIADWEQRLLALAPHVVRERPSEDRWSISEVIGHLVDSACNNHQRFVRAQSLTSLEFPRYEQNDWVTAANYRQLDWATLVALWCTYNRMLAVLIRNIPVSCLETQCTIAPYDPCTLGFLVEDYVDHLKHHLEILQVRIGDS